MKRSVGVRSSVRYPTEHAIPPTEPKITECSVCSVEYGSSAGSDG